MGGRTDRGRARGTHSEGVGGRTERGRARATHLKKCFHQGVDLRPCPVGWALSTELPQSLQLWSACFGRPHTLQVSPPALDDALHHLCPSLLGKVAGALERLANSRRAQYFPEFRCSLSVRRRRLFDPERDGGLRDHGGGAGNRAQPPVTAILSRAASSTPSSVGGARRARPPSHGRCKSSGLRPAADERLCNTRAVHEGPCALRSRTLRSRGWS